MNVKNSPTIQIPYPKFAVCEALSNQPHKNIAQCSARSPIFHPVADLHLNAFTQCEHGASLCFRFSLTICLAVTSPNTSSPFISLSTLPCPAAVLQSVHLAFTPPLPFDRYTLGV